MIINNEFQAFTPFVDDYSDAVFRLYNPLTCTRDDIELPQPYPNKVFDVIIRSRRILEKRTIEEICFAVDELHKMNSILLYGMPEDDCYQKYSHDYVVPFFDYMIMFDIAQLDEFPEATWSEFFAISALICVGIILESFDRDDKTYEQAIGLEDAADWSYFAFESTLYAVEAIAYAESLTHLYSDIDDKVKIKISLRNRDAINKRHASKNAIKDEFVEHYKNNPKLSKAESARRYYINLSDEKKNHFRDENCAVRSLLEHQRKLSK